MKHYFVIKDNLLDRYTVRILAIFETFEEALNEIYEHSDRYCDINGHGIIYEVDTYMTNFHEWFISTQSKLVTKEW